SLVGIIVGALLFAVVAGAVTPSTFKMSNASNLKSNTNSTNGTSNNSAYALTVITIARISGTKSVLADVHIHIYRIDFTKYSNGTIQILLVPVYNGSTPYNGTIKIQLVTGHYLILAHYHKLFDRKIVKLHSNRIVVMHMHKMHKGNGNGTGNTWNGTGNGMGNTWNYTGKNNTDGNQKVINNVISISKKDVYASENQ
ncbi:MAG: hypothetical protein ACP5UL_00780, partial [Thermoplasmata archaeon]